MLNFRKAHVISFYNDKYVEDKAKVICNLQLNEWFRASKVINN